MPPPELLACQNMPFAQTSAKSSSLHREIHAQVNLFSGLFDIRTHPTCRIAVGVFFSGEERQRVALLSS